MIQNNLSIDFLYTVRDVLDDESMSELMACVNIDDDMSVDDFSVSVKSYNTGLIKFLEKNKMVYEVKDGVLIIYIAHPKYIKSKIKPLKDFTALYFSLIKFRIVDEIFLLKGKSGNPCEVSLTVYRDYFTDILHDYILNAWSVAFGLPPRVNEIDCKIVYSCFVDILNGDNAEEPGE